MAVGLGTMFVGYWLSYFGWCSLRGPGVGLIDLIVPGRSVTIPGGSSSTSAASKLLAGATGLKSPAHTGAATNPPSPTTIGNNGGLGGTPVYPPGGNPFPGPTYG